MDDKAVHQIRKCTCVPVITYGIHEQADVKAHQFSLLRRGSSFTVAHSKGEFPVCVSLPGGVSMYIIVLLPSGVGLQEGVPVPVIQDALQKMKGVPGRFEL